jgi:dipeptidyl aminopeptidase/acylaminoacyl peptidase
MARPITPEDLWKLRRAARPAVAPGGGFAVVPVTDTDVDENKSFSRLYRVDIDGTVTPLTAAGTDGTHPAVSPDGTRVAFLRKAEAEEAKPQVHVMRLDGGEPERLTELPLGAAAPRWMPDGASLVFPAVVLAGYEDPAAVKEEVEARKDRNVKARVTEDRIYRYWNRWMTDGEIHHLFRLDVETGELSDLTPGWTRPLDFEGVEAAFDVSPDGEIAFQAMTVDPPYDEVAFGVYTMVPGDEPQLLWPEGPPMQRRPRYSPDGSRIAFGFAVEFPGFYADRVRLAVWDRATGERTVLTEDWDRSCSAWEWSPEGDRVVFVAEDDARQHLYGVPAAGGEPEVLARGGWITSPTPVPGGSVWCLHDSLSEPGDVAIAAAGSLKRITAFNADLLAEIEMGRVEDVRFPGANGDEIQMFVVYPPGFDETRTWPLVHDIHGGPHGVSGDLWHYRWNPQVFAAPGYVVATVNFHGSSSWGNDFAKSIHGAWGDMPTTDVEAATDHLLARGVIDPDRMAIAGGSYGGYLVSWIIGQTDRYAAAICHAGVTNLLGQWATDVTHGRHVSFGGHPWDREGLANTHRWSPTDHSTSWRTPTLVIHGEQDYRVVITQGLELYGLLKGRGVPARLVYYPDEGHWILKPQNSLHWYGEFLGWLERWLGHAG